MSSETDDCLVKEVDVFLAKSLSSNIHILQYPVRFADKPYTDTKYLDARIKPKQNKLEIEVELNTTNDNYSRTKGEQFAVNVDGKPGLIMGNASKQQTSKEQRYYKSNCMDKHVLTSTNATLGQMSRLYQLGILKNNKLHLNPVQSILQMKPSFEYFDIYDRKVKENKDAQHAEMDYSTEEEPDAEDKAELVTLKYSSQSYANLNQQELEPNWTPLSYLNTNEINSRHLKDKLYSKHLENDLKFEFSQEEFINKLIDNNQIIKTEAKSST